MKAKELRIGNLVSLDYMSGKTCRIQTIERDKCVFYINEDDVYSNSIYQHIKPIPLTEERLVKFGFEKSEKDGSYHSKGMFPLTIYFDGTRVSVRFYQGNEKRYVHQLQNLYFALTGEELEIKE